VTLWSGRVESGLAPEVWAFLKADDWELLPYDIAATRTHAGRLNAAGLLTDEELAEVSERLATITPEELDPSDEDVHSALERLLGPVGRKIHAGRSRNDQVAAAFRLYVEDASREAGEAISGFAESVLDRAEAEAETPMPGYTHLQRAQPVTAGHHLLAHAEPLLRDGGRLRAAYDAADVLPLGAGALAGSTLPLRPDVVAAELGFSARARNSMDAVADRDFALDLAHACVQVGLHLSRLGEDFVLWASAEFGFLRLSDRVATGSSLMPQKKNPDIAELIRGRGGRALGSFTALAMVLKGLPLTYDRDLQEDKPALFAAVDNAAECLEAARLLVEHLAFDPERLAAALGDPGLLATDSAERLVAEGTPFRQAHHEVATQVREGTHRPPWDVGRSLELRRLDAGRAARSVRRDSARLARWAEAHPPPLPS
jgi:argininosuccinate lyase